MSKLKPCPFCGCEDLDVHVGIYYGRRHESVTITCNDCLGSIYGSTEERAIAAWNTRHVKTCRNLDPLGYNYFKCSECDAKIYCEEEEPFAFCPQCGRKVEG